MTKPIGAICNLDCKYCYYLEKEKLYPGTQSFKMSDEVLESYVRQYIAAQDVPEINFAWQGGEPTLMGLDFFRRVVQLQQQYCPPGKRITNALQTNGTLLNDEWCQFFHDHHFLIGLSIDGPREMHDRYRVDKGGKPTFDKVMRGLEYLKQHQVEFNTLTVVNRHNSRYPLEVYNFLKKHGSGFMQFIPLVERAGNDEMFAAPPVLPSSTPRNYSLPLPIVNSDAPLSPSWGEGPGVRASPVTPWSVEARTYGDFLCTIFDTWVRHDVGQVFVQLFDVQLGIWMGMPASLCVFAETCGRAMAMEHNGDLYSCDHYVYPQYKLGNITDTPILDLVESPSQKQFGADKRDTLPRYCKQCEVRFACNGECPKHRFINTPDGEPGLNYLCAGYKKFLKHIDPAMRTMAQLLQSGRPAADIMLLQASQEKTRPNSASSLQLNGTNRGVGHRSQVQVKAGRNEPCPCGSGRKYKRCCGQS